MFPVVKLLDAWRFGDALHRVFPEVQQLEDWAKNLLGELAQKALQAGDCWCTIAVLLDSNDSEDHNCMEIIYLTYEIIEFVNSSEWT